MTATYAVKGRTYSLQLTDKTMATYDVMRDDGYGFGPISKIPPTRGEFNTLAEALANCRARDGILSTTTTARYVMRSPRRKKLNSGRGNTATSAAKRDKTSGVFKKPS